jgi:tetratricopeptide (TPR) repeat protein
VTGFHVVNVSIHFINSALVYLLIIILFNSLPLKSSNITQHKKLLALSSALIFTAHPIQTQAVTYIVQRFTSLATLFYLASVIMYIGARLASTEVNAGKSGQRNNFKTKLLYAGALLCTVCAMKTKEIAITIPFTLMTIEWMFFAGSLRKRIPWLMPFICSLLIIPLSIMNLDQPISDIISTASESTRVQSPLSRLEYFYTQLRVIVTYIRLLFLPINQNLDYAYPVYNSLSDPNVFLSGLLIVSILILASFSLLRYGTSKPASKLAVFGIFWFFITLSVESSIIPIRDVIFEHRLYLPSVGVFLTIATCIYTLFLRLKERWQHSGILLLGVMLSVVIALTFSACERNKVWLDEITLWEDVIAKSPDNARGHKNLGSAYTAQNKRSKARKHFEICIKLNDQDLTCHYNLGVIFHHMGIIDSAIKKYEKALQLKKAFVDSPYIYSDIHFNLGLAYQTKKLHYKAIQSFKSSIKIKPNDPYAHNDIGVSYLSLGLIDESKKHFQTAVRLSPGYKDAQRNLRRTDRK